jgi:ABC-2 type transport system permease protein
MKLTGGFKTLVWREIYRFISVFRQTITPPLITGFLYIFIFGFSIGSRIKEVHGVSYLEFLIPGLIMMYVIDGAYANTSSSLFISRWANNIEELLVTPISYMEMVTAVLIGGLTRSLVIAGGVWGVSMFFVHLPVPHLWAVLFFLIVVALIFSSLGIIAALYAEEFEHLTTATTFVITPLVYLGGVFNSLDMMPAKLQWLVKINPMFYMINGLRYGMLGITDAPLSHSISVVLALFTVLFSMAVYLFKIGYKLRK